MSYTMAPNRGIASNHRRRRGAGPGGSVLRRYDMAEPQAFLLLRPWPHVATIRATGKANPQSKGKFIDLDSFAVE